MVISKEDFTKQLIAIALVLGVPLVGLTYDKFLTNELKDYYVCTADSGKYGGQYFEFKGGLSKSMTRGYPYSGSTSGYKDCLVPWISLLQQSKDLGIDPYAYISTLDNSNAKKIVEEITKSTSSGICNTEGCTYPK